MLRQWVASNGCPWQRGLRRPLVFHAGELLVASNREFVEAGLGGKVVNVYGMAEFDSIACDGVLDPGLVLSPHLHYAIRDHERGKVSPLTQDKEGELMIRESRRSKWVCTRDSVRVLGRSRPSEIPWGNSWRILHLGRCDGTLVLPDGSKVTEGQILAVERLLPLVEHLQLQLVARANGRHEILVLVSADEGSECIDLKNVRKALCAQCFELADSLKHGVVSLRLRVATPTSVRASARGKRLRFVDTRWVLSNEAQYA
jgi:phenylacetate-coenzyme A ligase PaaK-like adenylate-forming protein